MERLAKWCCRCNCAAEENRQVAGIYLIDVEQADEEMPELDGDRKGKEYRHIWSMTIYQLLLVCLICGDLLSSTLIVHLSNQIYESCSESEQTVRQELLAQIQFCWFGCQTLMLFDFHKMRQKKATATVMCFVSVSQNCCTSKNQWTSK